MPWFIQLSILHTVQCCSPNAILSTFYAIVFTLWMHVLPHYTYTRTHIIIIWNSEWNILTRNYTYQAWKAIKNRCDMVVFRISFSAGGCVLKYVTLIHISDFPHSPPPSHLAMWHWHWHACLFSCRYYACE